MDLKVLHIDDSCTGCGSCANVCPKHCLSIVANNEGFYYPKYDSTNCIDCGLCERACHVLNFEQNDADDGRKERFYIYRTNDEKLREASTSGGAFSLFAEWVLNKGGVVFGSRFNDEIQRLEVTSTDRTSLESLRKSKYIESFTGATFSEVREFLRQGRNVLYCGTPCQVRGLKQFLLTTKTNTEKLLTIDFACHGVPSNWYFCEFKAMFERKGKKLINVDHRYKDYKRGLMWHDMTLKLDFSDGSSKQFLRYDYYYYYYEPFLDNLFLRHSCYHCNNTNNSAADISLGDFWGVSKYRKNLDDNKGLSFVCINNEMYSELWNKLSKNGLVEYLPFESIAYQYVDKSEIRARQLVVRDKFCEMINKVGYRKAVESHYGKTNIYKIMIKHSLSKRYHKLIDKIGRK